MELRLIIDNAPGKALIEKVNNNDIDAFLELYAIRKKWRMGNPLIHDGLATYGMFSDVSFEASFKLLIVSRLIKIALDEKPEYLHCALFTLSALIPDNAIYIRPAGFGESLLRLRERVKKYSFIPNLTVTWENLITKARCLKPSEPDNSYDVSLRLLLVSNNAYLEYFPISLLEQDQNRQEACPIAFEKVIEEGNKTCFGGVSCIFEHAEFIGLTKWWIFRCEPKVAEFIWIGYVYIKQDENNLVEIGNWSSHTQQMSKDAIHFEILKFEFSPD